ncbi:hypothetical protein BGZ73_007415 [Actinomortierella ambigua]|nr:hypothetical protein BGZ73_007415 [Actinomortierella ambigua]
MGLTPSKVPNFISSSLFLQSPRTTTARRAPNKGTSLPVTSSSQGKTIDSAEHPRTPSSRSSRYVRFPSSFRIPGPGTKVVCETASRKPAVANNDSSTSAPSASKTKPVHFIHNLAPVFTIPAPKDTTTGKPYVQTEEARKQQIRRRNRNKGRPKRSPNCFMFYRRDIHGTLVETHGNQNTQEISRLAGLRWKAEPEHVKKYYKDQAKHAKELHSLLHPGYKYKPGPKLKRSNKPKVTKIEALENVLSAEDASPLSDSSAPPTPMPTHATSTPDTLSSPALDVAKGKKTKAPKQLSAQKAQSPNSAPATTDAMTLEDVDTGETCLLPQGSVVEHCAAEKVTPAVPKNRSTHKKAVKKGLTAYVVSEVHLDEFLTDTPQTVPGTPTPPLPCRPDSLPSNSESSCAAPNEPVATHHGNAVTHTDTKMAATLEVEFPSSPMIQILNDDLDAMLLLNDGDAIAVTTSLGDKAAMDISVDASLNLLTLEHPNELMLPSSGWPNPELASMAAFEQQPQSITSMISHEVPVPLFADSILSSLGSHSQLEGTSSLLIPTAVQDPLLSSGDSSPYFHQQTHHAATSPFVPQTQPLVSSFVEPSPVCHPQPSTGQQQQATSTTFQGSDGTTFVLTVIPQTCLAPSAPLSLAQQQQQQQQSFANSSPLYNCAPFPSPVYTPASETSLSYFQDSLGCPNNDYNNNNSMILHPSFTNALPTPIDIDIALTPNSVPSSSSYQYGVNVDIFDQAFAMGTLVDPQQQQSPLLLQQELQEEHLVPLQKDDPLSEAWIPAAACASDLVGNGMALPRPCGSMVLTCPYELRQSLGIFDATMMGYEDEGGVAAAATATTGDNTLGWVMAASPPSAHPLEKQMFESQRHQASIGGWEESVVSAAGTLETLVPIFEGCFL